MNRVPLSTAGALTGVGVLAVASYDRRQRRRRLVEASLGHQRVRHDAPGEVRLSVVVPAYREAGIGESVRRLRADLAVVADDGGLEIVVVDDGSGDDTAERAVAAGADLVLQHPTNRGKGAAVRTGVLVARGRTIAFTDADLSYAPDQILELLDSVEEGWDVVVGSRDHEGSVTEVATSTLRQVGHRGVNLLTRAVLTGRHPDTQCGIKAFRSDAAATIFERCRIDRFAFDIEVLHLVERYGLSLKPVSVRVTNSSTSTVHVVRDTLRLVRDLVRIRQWAKAGAYARGAVAPVSLDARVVGLRATDGGRPPLAGAAPVAAGATDAETIGSRRPVAPTRPSRPSSAVATPEPASTLLPAS